MYIIVSQWRIQEPKKGVPRVGRNTMRSCVRGTRSIVTYYCDLEKGGSVEPPEPPLDPPLYQGESLGCDVGFVTKRGAKYPCYCDPDRKII